MASIWMPRTFSDAPLFQSSINFAASYRESQVSPQDQRKILVRKSQTIDMINAKLNCPKAAISDESIGAICLLAASAVRNYTWIPMPTLT